MERQRIVTLFCCSHLLRCHTFKLPSFDFFSSLSKVRPVDSGIRFMLSRINVIYRVGGCGMIRGIPNKVKVILPGSWEDPRIGHRARTRFRTRVCTPRCSMHHAGNIRVEPGVRTGRLIYKLGTAVPVPSSRSRRNYPVDLTLSQG